MSTGLLSRVEIGVCPATAFAQRRRLFGALERAYTVRFAPCEEKTNPAAVIVFGDDPPPFDYVPTLRLTDLGQPTDARKLVEFAPDALVPASFRGRTLVEREAEMRSLALEAGSTILARVGRDVVWTAASSGPLFYCAGGAPSELREGERLRDHFQSGRYFGLLPLVTFLQVITRTVTSNLQACFVIDDPNLHALSYGHISYPILARHAEQHGYHVAMAMIPLDAWFASRKTVSLFRAEQAQLSLLVHGNDHVRGELARARSVAESTAVAAQALRRVESFERRTAVRVSHVMAPPHSACSLIGARGVLCAGFAALCTNPAPRAPETDASLADWHPADFIAGGLPNISRHHLSSPRDDLPFRAFLGQPIVLYLHHEDLREGVDVLAEAVRDVAMCGHVRWLPVGDLAERQFTVTVDDDTAFVRLFSRRACIPVPEGVLKLAVQLPGHDEWQHETLVALVGNRPLVEVAFQEAHAEIEISDTRSVLVALRHAETLGAGARQPDSPLRPWPLLRRLFTEGRDRLSPMLR